MTQRWPRLVATTVLLFALLAGAYVAKEIIFSGAATTSQRTVARAIEARVVVLINQRRVANGLRPVVVDARLAALALGHSQEMAAQQYFAHDSPTGGLTFEQRTGRLHRTLTAENIAWGTGPYGNAVGLVTLWMHSPEHRRIILTPGLRRVGVGLVIGVFEGQHDAHIATADFSS